MKKENIETIIILTIVFIIAGTFFYFVVDSKIYKNPCLESYATKYCEKNNITIKDNQSFYSKETFDCINTTVYNPRIPNSLVIIKYKFLEDELSNCKFNSFREKLSDNIFNKENKQWQQ